MSLIETKHYEMHNHDHQVTVEHRHAPTAETVRLLREMEAEARKTVTDAVRVADCAIEFVVHQQLDNLNAQQVYRMVYSVNGKRSVVDHRVNLNQIAEAPHQLLDVLSRDIAAVLLLPHLEALVRR